MVKSWLVLFESGAIMDWETNLDAVIEGEFAKTKADPETTVIKSALEFCRYCYGKNLSRVAMEMASRLVTSIRLPSSLAETFLRIVKYYALTIKTRTSANYEEIVAGTRKLKDIIEEVTEDTKDFMTSIALPNSRKSASELFDIMGNGLFDKKVPSVEVRLQGEVVFEKGSGGPEALEFGVDLGIDLLNQDEYDADFEEFEENYD